MGKGQDCSGSGAVFHQKNNASQGVGLAGVMIGQRRKFIGP